MPERLSSGDLFRYTGKEMVFVVRDKNGNFAICIRNTEGPREDWEADALEGGSIQYSVGVEKIDTTPMKVEEVIALLKKKGGISVKEEEMIKNHF